MSYTMLDWLGDQTRDTEPFNRVANEYLVRWMREDGKAIVRMPDMDALVRFAEVHGVGDPADNDNWGRGDVNDAALAAIGHWRKERRDWEL